MNLPHKDSVLHPAGLVVQKQRHESRARRVFHFYMEVSTLEKVKRSHCCTTSIGETR